MAELAAESVHGPIPARAQLLAVAWLRWRLFANSFRRPKKGKSRVGGIVLMVLLRLVLWPFLAMWVVGPAFACGFFAWAAVAHGHPENLLPVFAGVFFFWQFFSVNGVNVAAAVSSFDPATLVRFPLPFGRYLVLRTLLGLLTASTIVGSLSLLAALIGIGLADKTLTLRTLAVVTVYAWMNVFFARMLAAWFERWLATRRAREIFGVLMAMVFLSFQFVNLHYTSGHRHTVANAWTVTLYHLTARFLHRLPPGFAVGAILDRGPVALGQFALLAGCTVAFLGIFALRLHKQFLGEYLTEGTLLHGTKSAAPRVRPVVAAPVAVIAVEQTREPARGVLPPIVAACLRKEWVYLSGNTGMLVGIVMPLVLVFIMSKGVFAMHPNYFLPGALGYAIFSSVAGLYNIFGADAAGIQMYLLAPIRLRDVIVAKNIASLALLTLQVGLAWALVQWVALAPIPVAAEVSAGCWIVFVIATNLTLGTLRSIVAPRKFVPGQVRRGRTPTNQTSSLLVLAVLFGSMLLQWPVTLLCRHYHQPWLAVAIFAPLAAGSIAAYAWLLGRAEGMVLEHRDLLAEELCGV